MTTLTIVLLVISILLIGLSYMKKDNGQKVQEEFEELSLQLMQDIFQLKKRVSVLENELNITPEDTSSSMIKIHDVLKTHVITLYTQGVDIENISAQTQLPLETVEYVVNEYVENN